MSKAPIDEVECGLGDDCGEVQLANNGRAHAGDNVPCPDCVSRDLNEKITALSLELREARDDAGRVRKVVDLFVDTARYSAPRMDRAPTFSHVDRVSFKEALALAEALDHENGNYSCQCVTCLREFIGHKRHVVCLACYAAPQVPMSDNETFYDAEIAPLLKEISNRCQARDMPFLAMVEYEIGEIGLTHSKTEKVGAQFALTSIAARSFGNADSLIMALMKYGAEHGHNSAFLYRLGIAANGYRHE